MQFDISSSGSSPMPSSDENNQQTTELLRELLQVQKAILSQLQTQAAAQDPGHRWRSLLEKWQHDYPELPKACKKALPIIERAYGSIVADIVDELGHNGEETIDNEYTLQDFLDRFGVRLGQLGNILNLVGPLVEASTRKKS